MYLISIYFDDKTAAALEKLKKRIADKTGNTFMLDNQIPPHITIAAVESQKEAVLIEKMDALAAQLTQGSIQFVSVGAFMPQVLYLEPVLSEYLHNLSVQLTELVSKIETTTASPQYQPFHWLPHCTMAKQLTKEEMVVAFQVLQQYFVPLEGRITHIGLARTNPHRDIRIWELSKGNS